MYLKKISALIVPLCNHSISSKKNFSFILRILILDIRQCCFFVINSSAKKPIFETFGTAQKIYDLCVNINQIKCAVSESLKYYDNLNDWNAARRCPVIRTPNTHPSESFHLFSKQFAFGDDKIIGVNLSMVNFTFANEQIKCLAIHNWRHMGRLCNIFWHVLQQTIEHRPHALCVLT